MNQKSVIAIICSLCVLWSTQKAYAQPANDDCSNAEVIAISNSGFGMGTFTTSSVDMTDATIQFGEPFYTTMVSAANDKKSVWFKFTLPTTRAVNVELKQPAIAINEADVGFSVYKTSNCLPSLSDLGPAKLTTVNKFGSTFNECLKEGDYLIQVGSKSGVDTNIFVELTTSYPFESVSYDYGSIAYNYGVLNTGTLNAPSIDLGCYSVDSIAEMACTELGANYQEYGQTIYQTFTTDNFIDAFRFDARSLQSGGFGNIGIKLLEGDITSNPVGSLPQIGNCEVLSTSTSWNGFDIMCQLKPNTTYSIQINVHKSVDAKNLYTRIHHRGGGVTQGANPNGLPANNLMGTLASSPSGVTTVANDVFSCNAFIDAALCPSCIIPDTNKCGTVNPAGGVTISGTTYKLNTWYTFTLAAASDIVINTQGNTYKRLFSGDVTTNCNLSTFSEFTTSSYNYQCFPAGTYSLQILGKVDPNNLFNSSATQLGSTANVSIRVTDLVQINNFDMASSGRVDSINGFLPLPDGIQISSTYDKFGCDNTVMPDNQSCGGSQIKTSYRIFTIGDADGDMVADSGILTFSGGNSALTNNVYIGDVTQLASAQGYPTTTITGLTDYMGCENFYWTKKVCITPGDYTLATFGDAGDIGRGEAPRLRFDLVSTQYNDPANPYNFGDITAAISGGTVSHTDIFDCYDNPMTIAGLAPCGDKLIYREFEITSPVLINIWTGGTGSFRLFSGQLSAVGIGGLAQYAPFGTSCRGSWNQGYCTYLPAGKYTVVSYASGGSYDGPNHEAGAIGSSNSISISTLTTPNQPKYNAPGKAYKAGITDYGPNAGSAAIPNNVRTYTFGREYFSCLADDPFIPSPGDYCNATFNRIAYYTFQLTKESYFHISGIASSYRAKVFKLDVATGDSLLMATADPLQSCIQYSDINQYNHGNCTPTWDGKIEVCRAEPGVYTLVIFATSGHIGASIQPSIYVDKIEESRFDYAWNAYDFGIVPGNNVPYFNNASLGDAGIVAGRTASNDFFSCKTGAFTSDPITSLCYEGMFPSGDTLSVPVPMPVNYATYDSLPNTTIPVRRNLWYTYQINGPGKVTVSVYNKSSGKTQQYPFAIYKSDETFTGDFASLKAGGGNVDSTVADGLTLVATNRTEHPSFWCSGCGTNKRAVSYNISPCQASSLDRYYIIVDHNVYNYVGNQVEVSIQFDSLVPLTVKYDYYSQANVINGLNQQVGPYTTIALDSGIYQGDTGTFACANYDSLLIQYNNSASSPCTKANQQSLWYTFDVAVAGYLRVNYDIVGSGTFFNTSNLILYREEVSGDSLEPGLVPVPLSSLTANGMPWGQCCMIPGRYYLIVTGCSYEIESVVPRVWIFKQYGDFCSQAAPVVLSGPGSASGTLTVNCHTIGTDFGEDPTNPNMGCLFGPEGYKSSWFKVTLLDTTKLDLTFSVSENTSAFASEIRYRMMYGDCSAMTAGPCNTDGGTSFTLNCMESNGSDYFVQVVTPENATGTVTLNISGVPAPNQSCEPLNPNKPVANFVVASYCQKDTVCFTNMSTAGADIAYHWDFSDGDTSAEMNPCHLFTPSGNDIDTFFVQLITTNTVDTLSDTVTVPVYLFKKVDASITIDAPYDTLPLTAIGLYITFRGNLIGPATSPATSLLWDFGNGNTSANEVDSTIYLAQDEGTVIVELELTTGPCIYSLYDTLTVGFEPIYVGGPYDGDNHGISETDCPVSYGNFFTGGPYDGEHYNITLVDCPVSNENLFAGGPYDGEHYNLTELDCPVSYENFYVGGPYDGEGYNLTELDCPVSFENFYVGGPYDGFDFKAADTDCPQFNASIYVGGPFDGEDFGTGGAMIVSADSSNGYICLGDSIVLNAYLADSSATDYLWNTGSTDSAITVSPTQDTVYSVIIVGSCDSMTADFTVRVFDPSSIVANAGTDTTTCGAGSKLLGITANPFQSYTWTPSVGLSSDSIARPLANVSVTTTYILSTNIIGGACPDQLDTMVFTVLENPSVAPMNDTTMCLGDSVVFNPALVGDSVHWYLNTVGNLVATTGAYVVKDTGTYIVRAFTNGCGEALDTVRVIDASGGSGVDYRTRQDGNWTDLNTWQIYNAGLGVWQDAVAFTGCGGAHYPTSYDGTILVQDSVVYDFTIPQGIDQTTVAVSGIIVIPTTITLFMVDSSGSGIPADIDNYGKIYITGTFTRVGTALLVNDHNSTVIYNGVNQNMWNGQYGKLHVDGGGIKTVTGTNTSATNDVLFINGHILLGNRNFKLWQLATTTGASTTTGWFITNSFGSVYKIGVGSTNMLTYNFEVGTSTASFNRMFVTNAGSTDNYKVRVAPSFDFDADYPCDALSDSAAVDRTWYIGEDVALGSDLTITPYWNVPDENAWFNRSQCYVGEYQTGTGWEQIGILGAAMASGTQYYQTASNITEPYAYSVGSCLSDRYMYKTVADGVWTDTDIWNIYIPALGGWYPTSNAPCTCGPADYPTSADSTIWVYHNVDYDQYIAIGVDELHIEATGRLVVDQDTLLLVDGVGLDLDNLGTLVLGEASMRLVGAPTWINRDNSLVHYNWVNQNLFPVTYGNLWIDGPSINPVLSTVKTVIGPGTYVRNDLRFMHGMIHLNDFDMIMDDSATVTGAHTDTGWVDATGLGYFIWEYPLGINVSRMYPIGGQYYSWASVEFQNVDTAGRLAGRVREYDHPLAPLTPIHRFWTMTRQTMSFTGTYDITVNYDDMDLPYAPIDDADEWTEVEVAGVYNPLYTEPFNWRLSSAGHVAYLVDVTINQGIITNNAFSDFTLMQNGIPLPVDRMVFTGKLVEQGAKLDWVTYNETGNYGFELERSLNGTNFEKIAFVLSKNSPAVDQQYTYLDPSVYELNTKIVYYRLKQIDFSGKMAYSEVVALPLPMDEPEGLSDEIAGMYPNPAKRTQEVILLYNLQSEGNVKIEVLDMLGQMVYNTNYPKLGRGKYKFNIPIDGMATGAYAVRVVSENNRSVRKLIVIE